MTVHSIAMHWVWALAFVDLLVGICAAVASDDHDNDPFDFDRIPTLPERNHR